MADFSFSFDSDNPFAEQEHAPKKAPAPAAPANESPQGASTAEVTPATGAQSADDEFSLDSFDFAFNEGASVNDSLPTQQAPVEAAPRELTPGEAALASFDFGAPESPDADAETPEFDVETSAPEVATPTLETPDFSAPEEIAPETVLSKEVPSFEPATPDLATPDFDIAEPEAEIASESVAAVTDESAPNDLAEFNALTFELNTPDETLADEISGDEMLAETAEPEPSEAQAEVGDLDFFSESATESEPSVESEATAEAESEPVSEISLPDAVSAAASLQGAFETADEAQIEPPAEAQTEGEFRRLKTKAVMSVAILGASGIGKNHARWFHRQGCRIVGFLGTSADSTAQTEADLSADFAFEGQAYTDLSELLESEKPDIVCVATPPPLHFGHVLQALEAGAHVLCEKPLVYAPTRKFRENRDGAKELVKVAAKKKLTLGTQLQYGAATPILCKLAGLSPTDVGDFAMELETLNPNSPRDPHELWIDLGPHPISVAQMLAGPNATLAEETIRFEPFQDDDKTEVLARFGINCADGRLLMVRAVVRALRDQTRKPRRRFSFNGHSVIYAPLQSGKGNFQAQFIAPDGYSSVYSDPVDYLIGDFVRACRDEHAPLISGDFGRENLEWMLKVGTPDGAR